jgi:hypothetical protein
MLSEIAHRQWLKEAEAMTLLYVILGAILAVVVVLVLMGFSDIMRYRRIRNM